MTAADALVNKAAFLVERFVRLRHDISVLFVGGEVVHVIGDDTRVFVHAAVRAHDKAVLVDLRKGGQGRDQTDVLTFGRLDGTHSAVMGVVNIADLERRSVAVEAPGAECGQLTLVRELRDRVGLIHKLRKLGRAEKFADYRRNGADIDKARRRDLHGVLRGHSFLDEPLETGDTDAELVLKQLAHRTHAAVAEVVDVVDRADPVFQIEVCGNGSDDIINRDVLVAKLFGQRTDLFFLLPRGYGIFAGKHGMESLAGLH